jgi:hypothetical protein
MRRRYVHRPGHPKASEFGMVAVDELDAGEAPVEQERAGNAFMVDRYMEGTVSPVDGSDIGSRSKRREHMKVHRLVDADDFKGEWAQRGEKRQQFLSGKGDGRDWVGRFEQTFHELNSRRK